MTRLPLALAASMALSSLAVAQVQLEFGSQQATYCSALHLRNGTRLLIGSMAQKNARGTVRSVVALTFLGSQTRTTFIGSSGNTAPRAATLDPKGNIWIVGDTDSDDFELVNPIFDQKIPGRSTPFVMELGPAGTGLLFSSFFGSSRLPNVGAYAAYTDFTITTADVAGNVYIGGTTGDPNFPTRGGIKGCYPSADNFGGVGSCALAVKINSDGKLIYSTFVVAGGGCTGSGSGCIGHGFGFGTVDSMAADSSGAVTISGHLRGVYDAALHYLWPSNAYVCRISPDGSKLLWLKTYPIATVFAALDSAGNADLFGSYLPSAVSNSLIPSFGPPILFVAQLKADGSGSNYSKDLGQSPDAFPTGILVDQADGVFVTGSSSTLSVKQPSSVLPNLGADFILKLDSSGSPLQAALRLPRGTIATPPTFDANGDLMVRGARGSLVTIPADYYGIIRPSIVEFENAASHVPNTGIFPGALLTLYGFNLPPQPKVLVNGTPAPLLFSGPNQINLQVPFEIVSSPDSAVRVTIPEANLWLQLPSTESIGIFTLDGSHASALNQDGSVNSQSNPAAAGSVISLFGTGAVWPSGMADGGVPAAALPLNPDLSRFGAVGISGNLLPIRYVGAAPGIINGVFQMNVQLPSRPAIQPPTVGMRLLNIRASGTLSSNDVLIYVN